MGLSGLGGGGSNGGAVFELARSAADGGSRDIRYSGMPVSLRFSEADDAKKMVLVEVGEGEADVDSRDRGAANTGAGASGGGFGGGLAGGAAAELLGGGDGEAGETGGGSG